MRLTPQNIQSPMARDDAVSDGGRRNRMKRCGSPSHVHDPGAFLAVAACRKANDILPIESF